MDYRQAEQDLLLGILDALPCPTALLNRDGQTVYVNDRPCPVPLTGMDLAKLPEVKTALEGVSQSAFRTELRGAGGAAPGLMEAYPVKTEELLVGALILFRPDPVSEELTADALPTVSEAMVSVWERIQRLAMLKTPALIIGEPGLGKADFAMALHRIANRQQERPFLTVRADSTPENLRDAALEAGGGTLFCERIDKWGGSLLLEATNLYTSRHVVRGLDVKPLTARLMATAEPGLAEKARRGEFPEDLYSRMNIMPVFLPPLRDRREDIVPAALRFASARANATGKDVQGFSEEARDILSRQDWKSNIDELREVVDAAVDACPGGIILPSYLGAVQQTGSGPATGSLRKMRAAYGRDHARAMINIYGNTVEGKRKAAAEMGVSLSTLYRILGSKR
ncbi:MAG: sigma 54-interacting transcriptional regulator [Oscillospiraceae bacterium]|jgi:DNA-binding NtrC family response regulator|nr:sigma 54-interacting transcriptional regulator [Oscillospiraceae bacterium]